MVKQVGGREYESCEIRCRSQIMYKECNTTSFVSNKFLIVSGASPIRLVAVAAPR